MIKGLCELVLCVLPPELIGDDQSSVYTHCNPTAPSGVVRETVMTLGWLNDSMLSGRGKNTP